MENIIGNTLMGSYCRHPVINTPQSLVIDDLKEKKNLSCLQRKCTNLALSFLGEEILDFKFVCEICCTESKSRLCSEQRVFLFLTLTNSAYNSTQQAVRTGDDVFCHPVMWGESVFPSSRETEVIKSGSEKKESLSKSKLSRLSFDGSSAKLLETLSSPYPPFFLRRKSKLDFCNSPLLHRKEKKKETNEGRGGSRRQEKKLLTSSSQLPLEERGKKG